MIVRFLSVKPPYLTVISHSYVSLASSFICSYIWYTSCETE